MMDVSAMHNLIVSLRKGCSLFLQLIFFPARLINLILQYTLMEASQISGRALRVLTHYLLIHMLVRHAVPTSEGHAIVSVLCTITQSCLHLKSLVPVCTVKRVLLDVSHNAGLSVGLL